MATTKEVKFVVVNSKNNYVSVSVCPHGEIVLYVDGTPGDIWSGDAAALTVSQVTLLVGALTKALSHHYKLVSTDS